MIKILSSKSYEDTSKNHGDCVICIEGNTAIIFDCGSEDHAKRAISVLNDYGIDKATVILSHNDDDHFKGIPYLIENGRVDKLFTILLLKYKQKLLDRIDDGRRNLHSIGEAIKELYSNIASLERTVALRDVYENEDELPSIAKRVGPDFEYMLDAAAKGLDGREGNIIDGETVTNAASVQIKITAGTVALLLTGDCTPKAIPDTIKLSDFTHIQLPHHGKPALAEQIFERANNNNDITYIVSDNTGDSNGGSDDLKKSGRKIKNTKDLGDIAISTVTSDNTYIKKTLGL